MLDNGIVGNHVVNWLSPLKERITVVTGERGSLVADTVAHGPHLLTPTGWLRWSGRRSRSFKGVVQGDVIRYAIAKPEPLAVELTCLP